MTKTDDLRKIAEAASNEGEWFRGPQPDAAREGRMSEPMTSERVKEMAENIGGTAYLLGLGEFETEDQVAGAVIAIQKDAKALCDYALQLERERDELYWASLDLPNFFWETAEDGYRVLRFQRALARIATSLVPKAALDAQEESK